MGADSTLVFFGVRYATDSSESDLLQGRTDPRIVRARAYNLAHWWGSFAVDHINEQEFLFIGSLITNIGHEGSYDRSLDSDELRQLMETTERKLHEAGFHEVPKLYLQFEPDY